MYTYSRQDLRDAESTVSRPYNQETRRFRSTRQAINLGLVNKTDDDTVSLSDKYYEVKQELEG